jgi:uncharacterized membrane protein YfcA
MIFPLPLFPLLLLIIASFFTSALSAATGMGGGVLLFSLMTLYFPLKTLIPIHGIIQFFNNIFILFYLKTSLKKSFLLPFSIGAFLGVGLGVYLFTKIAHTHLPHLLILILISYTLFKPKKLPDLHVLPKQFIWVGMITGIIGMIAGAIDPVLGPFFIRNDLSKEEIIANKAFMQALVHFLKIPVFYFFDFDYSPYLAFCLVTNLACIIGTKWGINLLKSMSETFFIQIFKLALFLSGVRIFIKLFS